MSKERLLISINSDRLKEFKEYADKQAFDVSANMAIIHLATLKLNELKEAKKV